MRFFMGPENFGNDYQKFDVEPDDEETAKKFELADTMAALREVEGYGHMTEDELMEAAKKVIEISNEFGKSEEIE